MIGVLLEPAGPHEYRCLSTGFEEIQRVSHKGITALETVFDIFFGGMTFMNGLGIYRRAFSGRLVRRWRWRLTAVRETG